MDVYYSYAVYEVHVDGYRLASFYVDNATGTAIAKNVYNASLPDMGGSGVQSFYLAAAGMLLLCSVAYLFFILLLDFIDSFL